MRPGLVFHLLTLAPVLAGDVPTPPDGAGRIQMTSWPAVSPDGSRVVFEWRDDLWSASTNGGRATRVTAHPARDS